MLVDGFPAPAFATNCWVVATGPGEQCVVVDPGIGVMDELDEVLAKHRLQPVAVLLTHGHLDHTFSVAPVCGARDVPAWIHPDDAELLADPGKALSVDLRSLLASPTLQYAEPSDVRLLEDGHVVSLAGMEISVDHAPGHTRGSVMFRVPGDESTGGSQLCLSGDVLFAGSIGRTDLPGGDMTQMLASLRDKVLPLADETIVLPGHGPTTTIGRERATNPFLLDVAAAHVPATPTRGL